MHLLIPILLILVVLIVLNEILRYVQISGPVVMSRTFSKMLFQIENVSLCFESNYITFDILIKRSLLTPIVDATIIVLGGVESNLVKISEISSIDCDKSSITVITSNVCYRTGAELETRF